MGFAYPLASAGYSEVLGATTGDGTTVTAGGANVKGSYTTIGTTSFTYDSFRLYTIGQTSGRKYRIDLAINTGGADTIIAADLWHLSASGEGDNYDIPVRIPKGATVKCRCQSANSGAALSVLLSGSSGDVKRTKGFSQLICLNSWTNTDPSNTITLTDTTQTGWTEVCASAANAVAGLYINFDFTSSTSTRVLYDLGWGASGSEKVYDQLIMRPGAVDLLTQIIPCNFPAGTRFAMRGQAQTTNGSVCGIALYGLVP